VFWTLYPVILRFIRPEYICSEFIELSKGLDPAPPRRAGTAGKLRESRSTGGHPYRYGFMRWHDSQPCLFLYTRQLQ